MFHGSNSASIAREMLENIPPPLAGPSPALRSTLDELSRIADEEGPVWLCSEPDCGASVFAAELHRRSRRRGEPLHFLSARALVAGDSSERAKLTSRTTVIIQDAGVLDAPEHDALVRRLAEDPSRARFVLLAEAPPSAAPLCAWVGSRIVTIPPLRERIEDLGAIARLMADAAAQTMGRPVHLSESTLASLRAYRFPGNLAELERMVLELAVTTEAGDTRGASGLYRVPVTKREVVLHPVRGPAFEGCVFLPESHGVAHVLTGEETFIPVESRGTIALWARNAIMAVAEPSPDPSAGSAAREVRVTVLLQGGTSVTGHLRYDADSAHRRVVDQLNQPGTCFSIYREADVLHIAKAHVDYVREER